MIKAIIKFTEAELPQEFILHRTGEGKVWAFPDQNNPIFKTESWRMLANDTAIELVGICDAQASFVKMPRNFDPLEIWPVRWGYPDALIQDHPEEVAQMEKDHREGKHDLVGETISWPEWLERFGKIELWMRFRTPEMERHWLSSRTSPGSSLSTLAGFQGYIPRQVLGEIRFRADFHQGDKVTTIWLACCDKSLLSDAEIRTLPGYLADQEKLITRSSSDFSSYTEACEKFNHALNRYETANKQLGAKTDALKDVMEPLNKLYPEVQLAEIRKRAIGNGVPDLIVDWVMTEFHASSPSRLPTKGETYDHCGPGTLIGKKLILAGYGVSEQRLADHLTVIRKLLVEKGWLAPREVGKTRTRAEGFQPDDRHADFNQPTPAESAEDRDDERQAGSE